MEPRPNPNQSTLSIGKGASQNKLKPSQLLSKQISGNALEELTHKGPAYKHNNNNKNYSYTLLSKLENDAEREQPSLHELNYKPKIVQFLNIADFSSYTDSAVSIDEPLFEPVPAIIQFTDYEPLQVKEKILSLRNKDKYARRIKVIPPDSRLFQVLPYNKTKKAVIEEDIGKMSKGSKVAPGMEYTYLVKFSPEAKIDYSFDLTIVTEREKFITPIIATGKRAMLDFPDVLDFTHCPVKYCTEKPIVIRNVGEKTTKWFLRLPPPFDANKKEGVLENGKNEQILIKFHPTESKEYNLEGMFSYDNLNAYVSCTGKAHDGQVYLSKSHIQMDDAYIGLQTQQTLQIVNKSNVKVDFEWRAFQTEKEEIEKKSKLMYQLEKEESEERMLIKEIVTNELDHEDYEDLDASESSELEENEQLTILKKQKKSEMQLKRKYKNIRKAIEDDHLLFQDEIFHIEPSSGQIWPNSALTITVTFEPQAALNYSCTAFCNISCKEERLALNLAGEGIGPKAVITPQDDIDLGDITITAIKTKDFTIENRGEIPASFQLLFPDTPAARMFKFDVDKGILGVGERLNFTVTFQSEMLGEFAETFRFKLEGSTELIPLRFRGHVTGPSFKFDRKEIDFGNASYSFPKKEYINLINTSPVSFRFSLWIPGDGPYEHREFEIHPQRDVINKGEQRTIEITFTPNTVKRYELTLKIDILGVGEGLFSIPIFAESFVPVVKIRPHDILDFGEEVFLRHPTTASLELINESDLPAKFEIVPQSKESKILAVYTTDRERGTIEKNSVLKLNITLETFKLGEINLPLAIQIVGNNNMPQVVNIVAHSRGPIVEVSEKELEYGNVEVLKDWIKTIRVSNKSLIKADFNIFTKNKQSVFRPLQKHGVLEPATTMEIQIVCTPDDNIKFADTLHFVIKEGFDIDVPLRAKGVGPTVFCNQDLKVVPFGLQYTFKYDHREIFIENKGRRPQKLVWQAKRKPEPKNKKKDDQGKEKEEENIPTFTIVPESVNLPPKTGLMFQFRAYSTKKGKISEEFELVATAGNDRKSNALYFTSLEGEFIEPNLIFSEKQLKFKYSWERNVPFMPIVKNLEITCGSQLPTNFVIKVPLPFSVSGETYSLLPGRSTTVKVSFDPGMKIDKVSGETVHKLQINHVDHPHKEYVNLCGEVCFPNLKLETNAINFGSIMHETTKKMTMIMKNVSEMALTYEWHFLDDEIMRERPSTVGDMVLTENQTRGSVAGAIAINEIFDILPLNGELQPGETEKVEFVFNALLSQKIKTSAICSVEGGPDYEMRLVGDSSIMTYKLNPKILDFGIMNFNDWEVKEMILENTGKVTFEFKINLSTILRENLIEVIPMSGSVRGNEKQKIVVRMCPGIPDEIREKFFIEIAHFEPEEIRIHARGQFPTLAFGLPRKENPTSRFEYDKLNFSLATDNPNPNNRLNETGSVFVNEGEWESDRRFFCDTLTKNIVDMNLPPVNPAGTNSMAGAATREGKLSMSKDDFNPDDSRAHSFMKSGAKMGPPKQMNPRMYNHISLASYTCDLENIVLGASKKKTFKIKNTSKTPVAFSFDQKVYRINNITIIPDRVARLGPDESILITLTYQSKKTHKFGHNKVAIPIDIRGGPRYHLDVLSNITIPEITIPTENIEFDRVLIGQRKTIFVRFENNKEVSCDWNMSTRAELVSITDKEGVRFSMSPTSGLIKPGKKQMVEFTFIPLSEKVYNHKFTLIIRDNPKVLVIHVKGTGTAISLEVTPENLNIGPVLPYDNKAVTKLNIYNPSDYDTEVYSLNFDSAYLQDEEVMREYNPFDATETLYFPVRYPGQPFWENIKRAYDLKIQRAEFDRKMKELTSPEQIDQVAVDTLQREIDEFNIANEDKPTIIYPPKVKDHLKHHVIIVGPSGSGKTQLAQFLSKTHKRHIINMNELLDWNLENNTELGLQAKAYLDQKKIEYDAAVAEREKNKKKKKKGEEDPEIKREDYDFLTEDQLVGLLKERMNTQYCNAGIIFENLKGSIYKKEIDALRVIMKAIPDQHLQLVNLYYPTDPSGLEASEIINAPPEPEPEKTLKELMGSKTSLKMGSTLRPTTKEEGRTRDKKPVQVRIKSAVTRNKENKSVTVVKEIPVKEKIPEKIQEVQLPTSRQEIPEGGAETPLLVDRGPLFEINYPLEITPEELKIYNQKAADFIDVILGQYKEPLPPPPVVEEKKDEKKGGKAPVKVDPKKSQKELPPVEIVEEKKVEEPVIPKIEVPRQVLISKDNRSVISLPIIFNYNQFNNSILEQVPEPEFIDMDKEPVPEPVLHQILRRPITRFRPEKSKYFTILTPKDTYINNNDEDLIPLDKPLEETTINTQARWIIPSKQRITLYAKVFARSPGNYTTSFEFESFFSIKPYKVDCLGVVDFPTINPNPINVFMQRKKTRPPNPPECYISKHFITTENVFDFGPLLIGKDPTKKNTNSYIYVNSSVFRMTNNGKFDVELDFSLGSSVIEGPIPKGTGPDGAIKKKGVFLFEQEKLMLKVDQTEDLRVWAFPDTPDTYRDQLICMIKDNPVPITFDMQCTGVKPTIQLDKTTVEFQRILLNQQVTELVKVKNVCSVPVKWKVSGLQDLPEEFSLQNTSGVLKPTQEAIIEISFKGLKQQKFQNKIIIEAEDNENIGIKQPPIEVKILAEAFRIDMIFDPNNPENMLNFGDVRCEDTKEQKFPIKNVGLYDIQYRFVMKKKLFRDNFKIEPAEGVIPPGQEKIVSFKFCSQQEIKLKTTSSTTDIVLEILEGKSLEIFNKVMMNVTVNAVFSKYSIMPLNNINFGPVQFDEPRVRTFEIKNEGIFEFNYTIFDYNDDNRRKEILDEEMAQRKAEEDYQAALAAGAKTGKDKGKAPPAKKPEPAKNTAKKDPKKKEELPGLNIATWNIDPPIGTIAPDSSQTIKVTFKGVGQKLYEQKLGIHISRRDTKDQPKGVLYEVIGESCVPGINTENFESIFEEQIVVPSLSNVANMQERLNSNVFSIEEKTFYFGTSVHARNPKGIQEQFKVTNPGKIPCTVRFEVKKRSNSTNEQFAFKVNPASVMIMPHHYKYVTVSFEPEIIASYGGVFEAIVEKGEQIPKYGKLAFDLRGDCALPTLKIEKPKEWADDRTPLLKFPKTRLDKSYILPIVLKNDGQIPATAEFELKPHDSFKFLDPAAMTISAKTSATFNVEFRPKDAGPKQWEIIVKTRDNPYENPRLMLRGEGYQEDIIFEGLPKDLEDEISFGDCVVNTEKKIAFALKNNSQTAIRFKWDTTTEDFSMVPRIGHVHPNGTKWITCIFKSQKTVTYKELPMVCQIQGVTLHNTKEWDDSMNTIRFVTKTEYDWVTKRLEEEALRRKEEEELSRKKGAKKEVKKPGKKGDKDQPEDVMPPIDPNEEANMRLAEPVPEPEFQPIEKSEKNLILKGNGVSDYVKYDCEVREIYFAPTLMFTSRVYTFNLKNTSLIQMKYVCKIVSAETGVYDSGYFSVNPKAGTVNPDCDEPITIKFSPKEVEKSNARLLVISIENLDPSAEKLIVELDGETDRPVCHFELPPSVLKEKKSQDLAQEGKYHVVEFESLGTKIKNAKRFYVVNPTNQGYEFEWSKDLEEPGKASYGSFFKCLTPKGTILSGKKYEMIFEYLPEMIGNHESYWTFKIPTEKLNHHFAFIGSVAEPNVFLEVGSINFGPLLLGGKNKEVIKVKNLEHVPFTFSFDRDAVRGEADYGDSLTVHPMSGVVGADSESSIEVTFQPKYERFYNYNLVLNVKQKTRPINLNIKGHGYNLHHSVNIDMNQMPISNNVDHTLDFGDIYINERKSRIITINNNGDFNFDFAVKKSQFSFVTISPENATVLKNEKVDIEVMFSPITDYKLRPKNHYFTLSIVSGPTYYFRLTGSARKPGVEFSFLEYDFGPSYVMKQPLVRTTNLEICNNDTSAMSVETLFEKTHYLDIQLAPGQVILPTNKNRDNLLKVPITFIPRDFTKYEDDIEFDINGLHKIAVKLKGEGVPLKLELDKSEHSNIDFGVIGVGSDVTKVARLVNQGKRAIALTLNFGDQLEVLKQKSAISVYPDKEFTLNPREGIDIEIRFNPNIRLHHFKNEVFYQITENKEVYKLLNVIGCCHGIELKLHQDTLGFGSVVVNSKLTREVKIENLGDINARFQWETTYCKRYFTISPLSGVIPAHEDLTFNVTFHPDVVDNDISFPKVKCDIENSEPLFINLLGKGIPQTKESIQEVKFRATVRATDKQKIIVKNPTDTPWKIKASINSNFGIKNYFSGKDSLEVPKMGQAEYEIAYNPLTMTKNDKAPEIKEETHDATLFFPTPDGSAFLYNLVGTSLPPTEADVFNLTIRAKKPETHVIPVRNWLKTTQRFAVKWEVENNDPNIIIKGANTIDIAGDNLKDYKLNIYTLKIGTGKVLITFRNEQNGEYVFYRINLNITAPDVIDTFDLATTIRESISKVITIENPLPKPVQILPEHIVCDTDAITFNPTSFTIQPFSEFGLEIIYRPLVAGEKKANLTVKSPDLGDFPYQLRLNGIISQSQKSMVFKTPIGTDLVQKFKFTHLLKKQVPYTVRVERLGPGAKVVTAPPKDPKEKPTGKEKGAIPADFIPDVATITVPAATSYEGIDQEIGIKFEPSTLGESRGILVITSPEGGEYQCLLIGTASPAVPKGPIKIGPKSVSVEFKNPFFEPAQFTIRLDNPCFTTTAKTITPADAKKVINVPITFKPVPGYLPTGRLIIQAGDLPAWIYYLQGEEVEEKPVKK